MGLTVTYRSPDGAYGQIAKANLTGKAQKNTFSRALPWALDTLFKGAKWAPISSLNDNLKTYGVIIDFSKGLQKGISSSINFETNISVAMDLTGAVSGLSKGGKLLTKLGFIEKGWGAVFANALTVADFIQSAHPFFEPWLPAQLQKPLQSGQSQREYVLVKGYQELTTLVNLAHQAYSEGNDFDFDNETQAEMWEAVSKLAGVAFEVSCLILSSAGLYGAIFSDKSQPLYQALERVCSVAYPALIASEAIRHSAAALYTVEE